MRRVTRKGAQALPRSAGTSSSPATPVISPATWGPLNCGKARSAVRASVRHSAVNWLMTVRVLMAGLELSPNRFLEHNLGIVQCGLGFGHRLPGGGQGRLLSGRGPGRRSRGDPAGQGSGGRSRHRVDRRRHLGRFYRPRRPHLLGLGRRQLTLYGVHPLLGLQLGPLGLLQPLDRRTYPRKERRHPVVGLNQRVGSGLQLGDR